MKTVAIVACSNGQKEEYRSQNEELARYLEKTGHKVLWSNDTVSYTHLRAHETGRNLVCRLLLEKKKKKYTETQKQEKKEPEYTNWEKTVK